MDEQHKLPSLNVPKSFDVNQAEAAIKAALKYVEQSKQDSLFMDESVKLMLEVKAFKTPHGQDHFFNIRVPHVPYSEPTTLDVLLVVPDIKDRDPDHVVGEVKDELRSSPFADKIRVREVTTLKQFRDDYSTYEAKRALGKAVDVVVADKKVWKMVPGILGKDFMRRKKYPLQIPGRSFKTSDLAEQIWYALHKTIYNLSVSGNTSSLLIGADNLSASELVENLKYIVSWMNKGFPGTWNNIQKLSILIPGENKMPPLPIYFSTGTSNDVKESIRTKGRKRKDETIGEISTQPDKIVKIGSAGDIVIKTCLNNERLVKKEESE